MHNYADIIKMKAAGAMLALIFSINCSPKAAKEKTIHPLLSRAPILCLHDIGGHGKYSITMQQFRELLEMLHGYRVVSLSTWQNWVKQNHIPDKPLAVLTFDDAYPSVHSTVVPLLQKAGFGATFYIYMARHRDDSPYYKMLSALPKEFEIGSHTFLHKDMVRLKSDKSRLFHELLLSRKKLIYLTGSKSPSFAWPYGSYDQSLVEDAFRAGYQSQVSTDFRVARAEEFRSILPRFTLYQPDPLGMARSVLKKFHEENPQAFRKR